MENVTEPFATAEGTRRFAQRHRQAASVGHFREAGELTVSSIGLGTYLGECDDETDARYVEAAKTCLRGEVNLLDTAVNYRHQRSERCIGRALKEMTEAGEIRRDEVVVCTKGGYIPFDGSLPEDVAAYFRERFVETGIIEPTRDVVAGCHCMTPAYLRDQIGVSLNNLGLESIDVYYLNNPETQIPEIGDKAFYSRLTEAFRTLEEEAEAGRFQCYGLATWNGFRTSRKSPEHLSLRRILDAAIAAGGEGHRLRFIQVPLNVAMLEAMGIPNQWWEDRETVLVEAVRRAGLTLVGSASLLQGRLGIDAPSVLRDRLPQLRSNAQCCLQFARSLPGVTTSLVGMSHPAHVAENLELAVHPPLSGEVVAGLKWD
jgi:aryl-alcohol dehydrogenase-like predicted oxidoreductase